MPQKEDKSLKSTRRGRTKRLQARRESNSLAASTTPVDSKPTQKTTNPKDNIQDRKLCLVQEEHIVTAAAASTIQQGKEHSSDSPSDSDSSDIIRRKIHITTEKKKKIEERTLTITASIPFCLVNMSGFDTEMTYIVDT